MDNELVFLTIITIIVLGFCIANIVSYLINKNHIKETEVTVISVKMPNPTTEKMRNSKWAIVTYKADRSRKMKCPFCGRDNTRVIDSRPSDDNNAIRRRRVCDVCGKRFTTYEKVETIPMIVIKKDNNRETYDRAKIEGGVFRACHKRPVSAAQIEAMIDDVESSIFSKEEREISSRQIGEMVMEKLKDLEAQKTEAENLEIVQMVRALRLTPEQLNAMLSGGTVPGMAAASANYNEQEDTDHEE